MNSKNTISITEARKRIFDLSEEVQTPGNFFMLTEKGKPKMALMSAEDLESILETLEVLEDFPTLKKDVEQAHKEFEAGDYWVLKDSGRLVKNKQNVKKVRNSTSKKSKKRVKKDSK